jgi:hypothetical protein
LRRALGLAGAGVAVLAATVVAGRWEANRDVDSQRAGMARIFAEATETPIPDAWRLTSQFRCLLYPQGSRPFAFELCFDAGGGLVEAIDRTSGLPVVSTLRSQPAKAAIHVDSAKLDQVLKEMDAFRRDAQREIAVRPRKWFRPPPPPPHIPVGSGLPGAPA